MLQFYIFSLFYSHYCRGNSTIPLTSVCLHPPDCTGCAVSVPEFISEAEVREQQQLYMRSKLHLQFCTQHTTIMQKLCSSKNKLCCQSKFPCHIVEQFSTFPLRFCVFFKCLMLDDVPDPRNSKWAKECTQEKVCDVKVNKNVR